MAAGEMAFIRAIANLLDIADGKRAAPSLN
jgi:hypothetical protein